MATTLTLRNEKGDTLNFDELDSNFLALDSSIANEIARINGLSNDYVTLATDQTISGEKTFGRVHTDSVTTDELTIGDNARIVFNDDDKVLQTIQGDVTLDMGSNWFYAKANTWLYKGEVLYLDSAEVETPVVIRADASAVGFNRDRVLGLAATDISAGGYGYIMEEGNLSDLDTGDYTVGDIVYLDAENPGALTKTPPSPPDPVIELGLVVRSNDSTGRIHVRVVHNYSTNDTVEGDNLYYTTARVDSDIDAKVTKGYIDNLEVDAGSVDGFNGIGIYDSVGNLLNGA